MVIYIAYANRAQQGPPPFLTALVLEIQPIIHQVSRDHKTFDSGQRITLKTEEKGKGTRLCTLRVYKLHQSKT